MLACMCAVLLACMRTAFASTPLGARLLQRNLGITGEGVHGAICYAACIILVWAVLGVLSL